MNSKQLNRALNNLGVGDAFKTCDQSTNLTYTISKVSLNEIQISLSASNQTIISKQAFFAVNEYLQNNDHDIKKPISVASSTLHHAAKSQNSNETCIHYIIPILNQLGCIGYSDTKPNTCWYITLS